MQLAFVGSHEVRVTLGQGLPTRCPRALSRPQGQRETPAGHVLKLLAKQIQNVENTQNQKGNVIKRIYPMRKRNLNHSELYRLTTTL